NAGADFAGPMSQPLPLQGVVSFSNSPPLIRWIKYAGPGAVTFANASQTNTTATCTTPGVYTLELSADDGIHAVAYDAVVVTVTNTLQVTVTRAGTHVNFSWTGGTPPFVLEQSGSVTSASWSGAITTSTQNASVPITNAKSFFRVKGQ
ncbi:MAG TPA: hypothetical protein VG347_21045, partial [Verrucomicrobiae bacterium]|nr:hypothetical protein [Verrucomicrobiae bacterium]